VEVSAVSVHPAGSLIAVSYRNGEVRVYRYPCQSQQVGQLCLPTSCVLSYNRVLVVTGQVPDSSGSLLRCDAAEFHRGRPLPGADRLPHALCAAVPRGGVKGSVLVMEVWQLRLPSVLMFYTFAGEWT
jgi:hypothetical protein